MTLEMETKIVSVVVKPAGEPIFCEQATKVSIDDEAGGEYVTVSQHPNNRDLQTIAINPCEWPAIRAAIDDMIGRCES